ncbi:GAF and ANTAR domain-containing protein [Nocardia abscessus]|uniref:GAF and ANTAR domain-containing protein n=1 Tax=Nocardia abscessus TaxID=120957 RepID=UPI002458C11C|nr:GAF and ANTAR domain-containing protein [Nocardia abscessus]
MENTSGAQPGDPNDAALRAGAGNADWSRFGGIGAVCSAAVRLTGADGAAVAVLGGNSQARELVYATDAIAQQVDELQFVVGEGPCVEAYRSDQRQIWPDLTSAEAATRWPAFAGEALALGVRAIFAFPVPGVRRSVGVLELYRGQPGGLGEVERDSGDACAVAVGRALRADWNRRVGALDGIGGLDEVVDTAVEQAGFDGVEDEFSRAVVFNAVGMVAVQLAVPADQGLARLRAYCYAEGRAISDVAADIVARRLSLRDQRDSGEG